MDTRVDQSLTLDSKPVKFDIEDDEHRSYPTIDKCYFQNCMAIDVHNLAKGNRIHRFCQHSPYENNRMHYLPNIDHIDQHSDILETSLDL